jgi:hypothetical protein
MQDHAHGWGLVGLFGGPLMALLLPWAADNPTLWWIIVISSTVGFVWGLYLLIGSQLSTRLARIKGLGRIIIAAGILTLVIVGFSTWYFWPLRRISSEGLQLREQLEKAEQLGPLFEYFEKDTAEAVAIQSVFVTHLSSSTASVQSSIHLPFIIFFSPEANAYVASIYFPPLSDDLLPQLMYDVAEHYRELFENFLKTYPISGTPPGRPAWMSSNMVFAKRIYLYHDNFISEDDLAKFRLLFSNKGADVEFRGPSYLQYKTDEKK